MSSDPAPAKCTPRGAIYALTCIALLIRIAGHCAPAHGDGPVAEATSAQAYAASDDGATRTAFWPFTSPRRPPIYESQPHNVTPHAAVARIIVPEKGATAYGSGTLVDVREQYGLVVTNWHVVRDSEGVVEVKFPSGFRSHARPLKVDSNWDLAALVIWRPPIEPVQLASRPPQPGDLLTIHGYGRGQYRIATGRCTTYYAPRLNYPLEMVELDVEARQGDSGGPIFNQSGELAGVLFGAGHGTTLGSYAPRVSNFLATLAPDIGQAKDQALVAVADRPAPNVEPMGTKPSYPSSPWSPPATSAHNVAITHPASRSPNLAVAPASATATDHEVLVPDDGINNGWYEALKSGLALVGVAAIALRLLQMTR